MPRKDTFHDACKNALTKAGWTITHDPYLIRFGEEDLYIDLGAEMPIAAEKEGRKIAVEIKTFLGKSPTTELERALGQFAIYSFLLARKDKERELLLSITDTIYDSVFDNVDTRDLITALRVPLLVFNENEETITRWIEPTNTAP